MAIIKTPKESSLKLKFSCGLDGKGNEITKSKSFANLKNTSTDDNIHSVGKGIAGLCKHTLMEITRVDNAVISE